MNQQNYLLKINQQNNHPKTNQQNNNLKIKTGYHNIIGIYLNMEI
jgi:hypothetical protein